jgi:hypothetical protein
MADSILNTDGLLERAKYMMTEYKKLLPVLFVETDKGIHVVGINVNFDKINKRMMMNDIGSKFSNKKENVEYLHMISAASVLMCAFDKGDKDIVDIGNLKDVKTYDAIIVASFDVKNNKRDVIIQRFEIADDNVTFKESIKNENVEGIFLLDAFMQGYYQSNIDLN